MNLPKIEEQTPGTPGTSEAKRRAKLSESALVKSLDELARRWPKGLWLFANGMNLYLMRQHPDGSRHAKNGGMDETLVVASFGIPNDGGDW